MEVVDACHRLYQRGWVANHDGNASVRLRGDRFLITSTAISKRSVDEASLLVVDRAGKVLEGRRKPFSELDLHLAIYQARPDVQAVLHAHPVHAMAVGLVEDRLSLASLPEAVVSLGVEIPVLPRTMPRSPGGAAAVAKACATFDAMLLSGNGAFTCGDDLDQAFLRMELVEHLSAILTTARTLGAPRPLSEGELATLLEARTRAGLGPAGRAAKQALHAAR
jgi:L-fuculose-phosphate aldolase